jgi:hypothetical protein
MLNGGRLNQRVSGASKAQGRTEATMSTLAVIMALAVVPAAEEGGDEPIRAERRFGILGEAAWNGLAGIGVNTVYHIVPELSLDAGLGVSATGYKVGVRARYNFLTATATPFLAAGMMLSSGTVGRTVETTADGNTVGLQIKPSAFLQIVGGLDLTARDGFSMLLTLGYARCLTRNNVEIKSGTPTDDQKRAFDIAFKSGPVLGLALGYTF